MEMFNSKGSSHQIKLVWSQCFETKGDHTTLGDSFSHHPKWRMIALVEVGVLTLIPTNGNTYHYKWVGITHDEGEIANISLGVMQFGGK
jgi:hypothetical protein